MSPTVYIQRTETSIQVDGLELLRHLFHGEVSHSFGSGLLCFPPAPTTLALSTSTESDMTAPEYQAIIDGEWCETGLREFIGMQECRAYVRISHVSDPSLTPFVNEYI